MKDINDIMPPLPEGYWGAVLNHVPGKQTLKEMSKIFPYNGKWHTILKDDGVTWVDGKRIQKYSEERLT